MFRIPYLPQLCEAQESWGIVLGQLQREMPKASFDTWVRDTQVVLCDDTRLVIGTFKGDAREWLESRLRSTVCRSLVGILNRSVEVEFIVIPESYELMTERGFNPRPA
jgi:chromosomal replication initiator protein